MADQMYKAAFQVKKTKFTKEHPELSAEEIHKLTVKYFSELP
jgi:hypothetical protein